MYSYVMVSVTKLSWFSSFFFAFDFLSSTLSLDCLGSIFYKAHHINSLFLILCFPILEFPFSSLLWFPFLCRMYPFFSCTLSMFPWIACIAPIKSLSAYSTLWVICRFVCAGYLFS